MKAIKALYQNGSITLSEPAPANGGPLEVLVIFPELEVDPWDRILNDPIPRPAFQNYAQECLEEIAQGKAEPLDLNQL